MIFSLILFTFHLSGPYDKSSVAKAHKVQKYKHYPNPKKGNDQSVKDDIVVIQLSRDTPFSNSTLTDPKFWAEIQKRESFFKFWNDISEHI